MNVTFIANFNIDELTCFNSMTLCHYLFYDFFKYIKPNPTT